MSPEQADTTGGSVPQIGRYRIVRPLGRGGMGEVYLGLDIRLNRNVAIKLLPASVGDDGGRLRRFEQEALAASALNHPNIVTVYEFGSDRGRAFLVTEFVEGRTLREALHDPTFVLEDVLHVAEQAAMALVAAHKAGIVHRDIKPENIMLREDGIVKVLDFGLAKLSGSDGEGGLPAPGPSFGSALDTRALVTAPGSILGTTVYMSPEQARGKEVDARSDVWSLGVVIHEMLTGAPPFVGETASDVIAAILTSAPPPLISRLGAIPAALEQIVGRTLSKNRADRYPTIRDLLVDLRAVHEALHARFHAEGAAATGPSPHLARLTAEPRPAPGETVVPTGAPKRFASRLSRHRLVVSAGTAALVLAVALAVSAVASRLMGRATPLERPTTPVSLTRLDLPDVQEAAISPDGRLIAYVVAEGVENALFVRPTDGGPATLVAPPSESGWRSLVFAPDNRRLLFRQNPPSTAVNELYEVPVGGGRMRKLITDVDSAVSFSPGGDRVVFRRNDPDRRESSIVVARLDGSGERRLATRQIAEAFVNNPAWSPDGRTVASLAINPVAGSEQQFSIVLIDVASGSQSLLGPAVWRWATALAWMPDGSELVLTAKDQPLAPFRVWRVGLALGDTVSATDDASNYTTVGVTADSSTLVAVRADTTEALYVAPVEDLSRARSLTDEAALVFRGVDWTPDGRVVYGSSAGGRRNIWIVNADGTSPTPLTHDEFVNDNPVATPDGRYIVFQSERGGYANIWRMNTDGGEPRQLTFGYSAINPSIAPDGRWVVYSAKTVATARLWKVSIDGGDPVELTTADSHLPVVSPDGRSIAFLYFPGGAAPSTLSIVDIEGSAPPRSLRVFANWWRWEPDGRALLYVDNRGSRSNFVRLPIDAGSPVQMSRFTGGTIPAFDLSPDGTRVVFVRSVRESDVVLIRGFR